MPKENDDVRVIRQQVMREHTGASKSVDRSLQAAARIEAMATDIGTTLHGQTSQIARIGAMTETMKSDTDKAGKILKHMERPAVVGFFADLFGAAPKYATHKDVPRGGWRGMFKKSDVPSPSASPSTKSSLQRTRSNSTGDVPDEADDLETDSGFLSADARANAKLDAKLDRLGGMLQNIKGMATDIGTEVRVQNVMLDGVSDSMDRRTNEIRGVTTRVRRL